MHGTEYSCILSGHFPVLRLYVGSAQVVESADVWWFVCTYTVQYMYVPVPVRYRYYTVRYRSMLYTA